ncbi:unnamed protein product [Ceratitis capitata]|uniref:Probable RNA polymerase II nuclear localization protein SLC7A6OS n=1 Tax=Ceratitis capitata TaxID=7213 RepID=A0A811UDZ8_CERCA|nr:unnamed protein product [Ceratitis capitata]
MPAVVRIKRRIDEEPLSAFILNSKKRRRLDHTEGGVHAEETAAAAVDAGASIDNAANENGEVSTILKFAGTIQEQDDGATTQLARLTKEAAKELVLQKSLRTPINHTERARQEMRQALHESRFRVVNCMRTTLDTDANAEEAAKEVTIVDIEKQDADDRTTNATLGEESQPSSTQNAVMQQQYNAELNRIIGDVHEGEIPTLNTQQSTDSDTGYVYDLYLPENELQMEYADMMDNNNLSVRPYDDLVYEDRFNDDDDCDDSEDSNIENYYTNDYPDEDDDYEDNISMGLRRMRMGTNEGYIHTIDGEDSSVSEYGDSSSDEFAYDDEYHRRGAVDDDDDDDDVDYYDAGDDSSD